MLVSLLDPGCTCGRALPACVAGRLTGCGLPGWAAANGTNGLSGDSNRFISVGSTRSHMDTYGSLLGLVDWPG